MSRETLRSLKRAVSKLDYHPSSQTTHALIDHGIAALDAVDGGDPVIRAREELRVREREVGLALADIRTVIHDILDNVPADLVPAVIEGEPLIEDLGKVIFILDMVQEMLKAKGPKWHREWSWYQPRIEEEFGA